MARVFITGSSDGLGLTAAKVLIEQGHEVVLHGRNDSRSQDALAAAPWARGAVTGDLFSNRISVVNWILLLLLPYRGHGSLRGRKGPPQHLVRSAGAAMSTAGLRGVLRGPRPSVAVACTLATSGNHPIRGDAWMDPGEGIVRRLPAARTSGVAPPTATCCAESRRVFGQAPRTPCRRLIAWQSTGPSPSGLKPV